ncbi:accessory gene regulator B family protein [Faecalibacillus intestinalis]
MIICNKITNFLINKNIISINDREIYIYGLFVILYNAFLLVNIIIIGFDF